MTKERKPRKKSKPSKVQKELTLYVRLPHTIRNKEEIEQLFFGNFKVRLLRQASRFCHVIFSSVEEKVKNWEAVKNKKIDGKNILITPVLPLVEKGVNKVVKKKIVMPEVKEEEEQKITQTLFITNIKCGTKPQEVQEAIEGCGTVVFLKAHTPHFRCAVAKVNSIQIAADYLNKTKEWPVVNGNMLKLKPDTRVKHKKGSARKAKITNSNTQTKPGKESSNETKSTTIKKSSNLKQPMKAKSKNLVKKVLIQKV